MNKKMTERIAKAPASKRNKSRKIEKRPRKKSLLKDVLGFRWLKKAMVGKTQEESLDLLDQWILKKRALSLFF